MHTFITDKLNTFACILEIEGAALDQVKARLILNNETISIVFDGNISSTGTCEFNLVKLTKVINVINSGTLSIEVIVDSILFKPYASKFIIKSSKLINVDNIKSASTPKITVTVNK